jgi:transcription antitermination factor NusG
MGNWYIIEAYEGKDFDAVLRLAAAGFNVWRPVDEVRPSLRWQGTKLGAKRRVIRKVPRFGRYLFAELDLTDAVQSAIKQMRGVHGFLCFAGTDQPAIIPPELIQFYRNYKPLRWPSLKPIGKGDRVRITGECSFTGHEGVVEDVDKRGILRVTISIFGGPTPLIISVGHVELVEQGPSASDRALRQSAQRTKVSVSAKPCKSSKVECSAA